MFDLESNTMENQDLAQNPGEEINDSNEQLRHPQYDENQQHIGEGQNANQDNTSLASDGPVSKTEGNGTSPDLNDTAKITNAYDLYDEDELQGNEDTSQSLDVGQQELDLDRDDREWDTDLPEEMK